MSYSDTFVKDVIDEIGTQSLARLNINIFSFNTYNAYGSSVTMSNDVNFTYNRNKNNSKAYGNNFESLNVGNQNTLESFLDSGNKAYNTDTLGAIKKIQQIRSSGKKIENLSVKDRETYDFIMQNYSDEVEHFDFSKGDLKSLESDGNYDSPKLIHHESTDVVVINKDGQIIKKEQLKVIKNTKDLLKDKYLDNNDELKVPFDDFKVHKQNLEAMKNELQEKQKTGNFSEQDRKQLGRVNKALEILNKDNLCNRLICENPRAFAVANQTIAGAGHIVSTGASDAVVVALSTLANGAIYEIKDYYYNRSNEISFPERIKRLIKAVINAFTESFKRGASFGVLDVIAGIASQIFKQISGKIKQLWKQLRTSAKSIFNAIWDFITGKIKSFSQMLSTIIKAFLSAIVVGLTAAFEVQLETTLSPILTPLVASVVAPAIAIVIGAIAVVTVTKGVDAIVQGLMGIIAKRKMLEAKAEEIAQLCDEYLPKLSEEHDRLASEIKKVHEERLIKINSSCQDLKKAIENDEFSNANIALNNICSLFGIVAKDTSFEEIESVLKGKHTGIVQF